MSPRLGLPLRRAPGEMRILQPFGANPEAYAAYGLAGDNGIDFEAEEGEVVVAVDDGRVMEVRLDPAGYGVTVKLAHSWGESRYAHGQMLSVPIDLVLGHVVRRGERVLLAGRPGRSETARLHFALRLRQPDGSLDYGSANGLAGWHDPLPHLREALALSEPDSALPVRRGPLARRGGRGRA